MKNLQLSIKSLKASVGLRDHCRSLPTELFNQFFVMCICTESCISLQCLSK